MVVGVRTARLQVCNFAHSVACMSHVVYSFLSLQVNSLKCLSHVSCCTSSAAFVSFFLRYGYRSNFHYCSYSRSLFPGSSTGVQIHNCSYRLLTIDSNEKQDIWHIFSFFLLSHLVFHRIPDFTISYVK